MNETLAHIFGDFAKAKGEDLNDDVAKKIEALVRKYGKPKFEIGDCIICIDASSKYGRFEMRTVEEFCETFEEGDNELEDGIGYASIIARQRTLWFGTKGKQGDEPYNGQGCLYMPYSWDNIRCIHEREKNDLYTTEERLSNISFSIEKYWYNDFWKTIRLGIVVDEDKKYEFIHSVVTLLKL